MIQRPIEACQQCALHVDGTCGFAPQRVAADVVLIEQGAAPDSVSFIKDGLVTVSTVSARGTETWGAIRGPRSMIGFEALVQTRSSAEVRTLTDVIVCRAPLSTVRRYLAGTESTNALLSLSLSELLDQRRDVGLRTGSAESRLARFALACTQLGKSNRISTAFTKVRIAAIIGIRPETLSRVLRRFREQGWLEVAQSIHVLNRAALEALAGE